MHAYFYGMRFRTKLKLLEIFLFFIFIGQVSYAQEKVVKAGFKQAEASDTTYVNRLIEDYQTKYKIHEDSLRSGLKLVLEAYYLSDRLKFKKGIMKSAIEIASIMLTFKNLNEATDYYFIAIKNAELCDDKLIKGKSLMGLGLMYYNQKKWKEAKSYFDAAVQIFIQGAEQDKLSILNYLKGLCYTEMGIYDSARVEVQSAYEIACQRSDSSQIFECTVGLAKLDCFQGAYDAALAKYHLAESYYTSHLEKVALAIIYEGIAQVNRAQGNYPKSLENALKGYHIAHNSVSNMNLVEITLLLSEIYETLGKSDEAYRFLLENTHLKDSINRHDISEMISVASINYAFEKKETKYNEELQRYNRRKNIAIYASIFLALIGLIVIIAYQTLKKERRKSEDLLLNILPSETAEELKKYGKAIPKKHDSVTIMFCDVRGFTNISSSMTPESVVNMIDFYFRKFDEIITMHGLEKIKTIGDAYMCVGGLHSTESAVNHASRVIDAAIDIMRFAAQIKEDMVQEYGDSFSFRIGIHTGEVVSGVVGSKKYAYDIWGDTVNVAARMEQTSEAGQINISGDTNQIIADRYPIIYRGKIQAKHKGELDMYYVGWN